MEKLQTANSFPILPIHDEAFKTYGQVLAGYDFGEICITALKNAEMPVEGTVYEASFQVLEN